MKFKRGTRFALIVMTVFAAIGTIHGCARSDAQPLIDQAFALMYPELSARILKEFHASTQGKIGASNETYIPLPSTSHPANIDPKTLYIASPAVAASLTGFVQQTRARGISLLAEEPGFSAIVWDSAWAYRQLGFIAGFRTATLRTSSMPDAAASILFSRGIGRSDEELKAFKSAFIEGANAAGTQDLGSANKNLLTIMDVDSLGLHGNRQEQTLAACSQMLQNAPAVVIIAAGSLGAFEKTLSYRGVIIADLRGLGQNISKKKLFAALEENVAGLTKALSQLVRSLNTSVSTANTTRVKPNLYLSSEARRDIKSSDIKNTTH